MSSTYMYSTNLYTVDWEIFVVKKVSWVAPPTKIKCTNFFFFLQRNIMYMVFLCTCAFCMQLPFNPRHLMLDHL